MPDVSLFDQGAPPPCPHQFNMADYVLGHAATNPNKVALRVIADLDAPSDDWSFGRLDLAIRRTAAALIGSGLHPGDRVALRLGNTPEFPLLFFGTVAAGGIAVPTSAQLTTREFHSILDDMTPRFAAISQELMLDLPDGIIALPANMAHEDQAPVSDFAATRADDPAFLIYTSGTSGGPKGVLHAQRSAWARRMMWQDWYGLSAQDTLLHVGAFNWTYTLGTGLTDPWAAGATTVIYNGPRDASIWPKLIERFGATIFAAVPGVYRQILKSNAALAEPLQSLRHGLTAGEKLPDVIRSEWEQRTKRPVYEALGMSEISTYVSERPGDSRVPGTSGRPQTGRRVSILDPETRQVVPSGRTGVLAVSKRDPGLMLRYWNRPEETASSFQGEWFLTGDMAAMHANGSVEFHGRADDVMTSLGYRVSPTEVEDALSSHPQITDVAVAELPVRADLSLIAAFIVSDCELPSQQDLAAHAAQHLAAYKCPRIWIQVDKLPRTANGKLLRRSLINAHRQDL